MTFWGKELSKDTFFRRIQREKNKLHVAVSDFFQLSEYRSNEDIQYFIVQLLSTNGTRSIETSTEDIKRVISEETEYENPKNLTLRSLFGLLSLTQTNANNKTWHFRDENPLPTRKILTEALMELTFPTRQQPVNLRGNINTGTVPSVMTTSAWNKLASEYPYSMLPKHISLVAAISLYIHTFRVFRVAVRVCFMVAG